MPTLSPTPTTTASQTRTARPSPRRSRLPLSSEVNVFLRELQALPLDEQNKVLANARRSIRTYSLEARQHFVNSLIEFADERPAALRDPMFLGLLSRAEQDLADCRARR